MPAVLGAIVVVLVVALGAGAIYLGFVEPPPPVAEVNKVLPDERFPR